MQNARERFSPTLNAHSRPIFFLPSSYLIRYGDRKLEHTEMKGPICTPEVLRRGILALFSGPLGIFSGIDCNRCCVIILIFDG